MTAMNIDTPHAGCIDIAPERIIEFPEGLPGFEDLRRYTLFHPEGSAGTPNFFILQSIDDPAIAFNIADPARFGFNYEIDLSDAESDALDLKDPADAAIVVMLVKEASGEVRANLKAPLVLNLRSRRGLQHVFSGLNYQIASKSPEKE